MDYKIGSFDTVRNSSSKKINKFDRPLVRLIEEKNKNVTNRHE